MTQLRVAALAYAAAGVPVLPLHAPAGGGGAGGGGGCSCRRPECDRVGKHPRWHPRLITSGLRHASTDPRWIDAWWSAWPDANIGLRTGVVFDVCDIDSPDGLRAVRGLLGDRPSGAGPPAVRTGSGGYHVYVAPTGAGNRARLLPGVDWRGAGGYVVAPPSRHASGEAYHWIRRPDGAFPPCPPALRALVLALPPGPVARPAGSTVVHHPAEYAAAALAAEEHEVRTAEVGRRNTTLYAAARSLGRLVAAGFLGRDEVTATLAAAAGAAGLGRDETLRTIRSGLTAGVRHTRPPAAA